MSRRISWASKDSSYSPGYKFPFDTVAATIFYRPDGGQVWGQVVRDSNPGIDNPVDLPRYDNSTTATGMITSAETKQLYDKWINSGNPPWIPLELDGAEMDKFNF